MFLILIATLEIFNSVICVFSRPVSETHNGISIGQMVALNTLNISDGSTSAEGLDQQFTVQLSNLFVFNLPQTTSTERALFPNTTNPEDEFMTSSEEDRYMAEDSNKMIFPDQLPSVGPEVSIFKIDGRAIFQVPHSRKPCPARQRRTRSGQCRVVIRMA